MQKFYFAAVAAAIVVGGKAHAQEAGSVDLGGFELFPSVGVGLTHDSNVTRSDTDEIESWKSTISPEFVLVNSYGLDQYQIGYKMTRADYFSSQEDSFTDHLLTANAVVELDVRNRISLAAEYDDGHDDRGTLFSIGRGETLDSVDTYKNYSVSGTYTYGAPTSKGRIDVTAGYFVTDYDINTDAYRSRDRDTVNLGTTFYYNVLPATDLTFDVIYNDITYDFALDADNPLDSEETRILVGAEWEGTAQTTGYVKVGNRKKEFKDATRDDFSGLDWQVGVIWAPKTYSTVELTAFTNTNETFGEGNFIDTDTVQMTWNHEWLDRVSTTFRASHVVDKFTGGTDRQDDNMTFGASLNYQMQRYVLVQLGFDYDERDSNRNEIDFDRNLLTLSVSITL
ncbi:outer membrane beta-barrel protein [Alteromonas sp. KUL49]|uniref:outer membrane beta-barrel protein n=1 Tax=Alteromonas sp. KUL49 TaxID=2480798 RepID=UPI00102EF474|nr:outer membrane beta-barrel protein [Alteromonas sp. KUL49]TAP40336.1 hypothetical protein EYS00_09250 [Alteromonas sp. KUL49]GEA11483.1 hypothetical protein KUL49_18580 [Alteromonas sp. KUL49]